MTIKKLIRKLVLSVKPIFWSLPPAGGFINPFIVYFTALTNSKNQLRDILRRTYPDHELYFLNSGKSALTLIYSNIKLVTGKDCVAMPAYTCPDVASSAVQAGMKIFLLDFEQPKELQVACPRIEDIHEIACTIGTNLYGLNDTSSLSKFSERHDLFHIEDVCQAALSNANDLELGVNGNSIGVISYARGKAYCGVGGGLLLVPKNSKHQPLLSELNYHYRELPKPHFIESVIYGLKLLICWILERPYFYWVFRFLPFTGLGQTKVYLNSPIRRGSRIELALMLVAKQFRDKTRKEKLRVLVYYKGQKENDLEVTEEVPIRLPVILTEKIKQTLIDNNSSELFRYGISTSYPHCIDKYEELREFIIAGNIENAINISKTIVTLPVHKYVRRRDVKQIFKLIRNVKRKIDV